MNTKFVNFTNHPHSSWEPNQIEAALSYGDIVDIPFPNVSPVLSSEEIYLLGQEYTDKILAAHPAAVMCQGEFSLAYNVIYRLKGKGIKVVAACSERNTITVGNERRSFFSFVQFREYL